MMEILPLGILGIPGWVKKPETLHWLAENQKQLSQKASHLLSSVGFQLQKISCYRPGVNREVVKESSPPAVPPKDSPVARRGPVAGEAAVAPLVLAPQYRNIESFAEFRLLFPNEFNGAVAYFEYCINQLEKANHPNCDELKAHSLKLLTNLAYIKTKKFQLSSSTEALSHTFSILSSLEYDSRQYYALYPLQALWAVFNHYDVNVSDALGKATVNGLTQLTSLLEEVEKAKSEIDRICHLRKPSSIPSG